MPLAPRTRFLPRTLVVALACLAGVACSEPAAEPVALDHDEVVARYLQSGLNESVAACVAGWTERSDVVLLEGVAEPDQDTQLVIDEAILSCLAAEALINPTAEPPATVAFVDEPFTLGDDEDLDALWLSCDGGDGHSCDTLWASAPSGSEYEEFGVTCGRRLDLLDCTEELLPTEVSPD